MSVFVALLRGINVGGKNIVSMAALQALGEQIGFANVRTLLQSGNVVFESNGRSGQELEREWEEAIAERFRLQIEVVVRSKSEWKQAIDANPIPIQPETNTSHLFLYFLGLDPDHEAVQIVEAYDKGPEKPIIVGRTLYVYYPSEVVKSKLTGYWIESKLGVVATARNWNTIQKIASLLDSTPFENPNAGKPTP